MLIKPAFIGSEIQKKNCNIVKYYYNLKECLSILIYLKYIICKVNAKLNFQHHYSSLQCMILQKSYAKLISILETVVLLIFYLFIFLETDTFCGSLINKKK